MTSAGEQIKVSETYWPNGWLRLRVHMLNGVLHNPYGFAWERWGMNGTCRAQQFWLHGICCTEEEWRMSHREDAVCGWEPAGTASLGSGESILCRDFDDALRIANGGDYREVIQQCNGNEVESGAGPAWGEWKVLKRNGGIVLLRWGAKMSAKAEDGIDELIDRCLSWKSKGDDLK